jgi:hypothetical protein
MKCEQCKFYVFPEYTDFFDDEDIKRLAANGLSHAERQKLCDDEHSVGTCKRYPPTIIAGDDDFMSALNFAVVFRDDWCGEFKKRKI